MQTLGRSVKESEKASIIRTKTNPFINGVKKMSEKLSDWDSGDLMTVQEFRDDCAAGVLTDMHHLNVGREALRCHSRSG